MFPLSQTTCQQQEHLSKSRPRLILHLRARSFDRNNVLILESILYFCKKAIAVNELTVSKVEVADSRLTVSFDCKGRIKKFFYDNKFIAEYDTSVEEIPEATLVIPFLATIAPIAWVNQAEVFVETVDETFLSSLDHIRETLQKFYPQLKFGGKIQAEKIVSPHVNTRTRRMALFSGGVDSWATFIRHQDENPILVSVQDVRFTAPNRPSRYHDLMNVSSDYLKRAFGSVKPENRIIRSNLEYVPRLFMLDMLLISAKEISGNWYQGVMHGLALTGLCAPLTYLEKVDKLYIASSFTADAQLPWGSHPEIDNKIEWTGTRVEHDGYELSRQDKLFLIADYIMRKDSKLQICTCIDNLARKRFNIGVGKNCNQCEKCSRTILGLEIAGIDPNEHGFSTDAQTFSRMRKNIEDGTWRFGDDERYMWIDLQKHASNAREIPHYEARILIEWLRKIDVKSLKSSAYRNKSLRYRFIRKTRLFPLLMALPYPILQLMRKFFGAVFG